MDGAHCSGALKGTLFSIVKSSANHATLPIMTTFDMRTEGSATWRIAMTAAKRLDSSWATNKKGGDIIDGDKGMLRAHTDVLPDRIPGLCANHGSENMPACDRGLYLRAANPRSGTTKSKVRKIIKMMSPAGQQKIIKFGGKSMCFSPHMKTYLHGIWVNAVAESHNAKLKRDKTRGLPPLAMLQSIVLMTADMYEKAAAEAKDRVRKKEPLTQHCADAMNLLRRATVRNPIMFQKSDARAMTAEVLSRRKDGRIYKVSLFHLGTTRQTYSQHKSVDASKQVRMLMILRSTAYLSSHHHHHVYVPLLLSTDTGECNLHLRSAPEYRTYLCTC